MGGSKNNARYDTEAWDEISAHFTLSWSKKMTNGFFLRADQYASYVNYIDELARQSGKKALHPYGGYALSSQSHGEGFTSIFSNRFSIPALYIFDEPEAALSPERQISLLYIMQEMISSGSQIIMATHSPLLMSSPHSEVLQMDDHFEKINYKDTKHFVILKRFFADPESFLKKISLDTEL